MSFRVACSQNIQPALLFYYADQLIGVLIIAGVALFRVDIASESENVLHTACLQVVDCRFDLRFICIHAGQMSHCIYVVPLLYG